MYNGIRFTRDSHPLPDILRHRDKTENKIEVDPFASMHTKILLSAELSVCEKIREYLKGNILIQRAVN